MSLEPQNQYTLEKEVEFDGERYLVRDNGAVYRRYRTDRRRNSIDENWSFGRLENNSGYLFIGSHPIHRIVAYAFLGNPPSSRHVVDHIDMDRQNNRADNLRWVTRLDNVLRHPSTRKRIIDAYGSLEKFVENPGNAIGSDPSIEWLKTQSSVDAERSRQQLLSWGESEGRPKDRIVSNRVYGTPEPRPPEPVPDIPSLTPMAVQRKWKTPTEFPGCPLELGSNSLAEYANNLPAGAIFARDRYKQSLVVIAELGDSLLSVLVQSSQEDAVKPLAVAKVTIEDGKFIHEACGTFFGLEGAKKVHYQQLGIPFESDSIYEYC